MVAPAAMLATEVSVVTSEVFGQTTSGTLWALCKTASGLVSGVDEPTREVEVAAVAMAVTVAAAAVEVLGVDVMLRSRPASTMLMEDTLLSALIRLAVVV